jgi:hypothetical protein
VLTTLREIEDYSSENIVVRLGVLHMSYTTAKIELAAVRVPRRWLGSASVRSGGRRIWLPARPVDARHHQPLSQRQRVIDRAAHHFAAVAPDNPHVTQRAADTCAALLRELAPTVTTTPEQAAYQAEQAAEIAARFKEFFGPL